MSKRITQIDADKIIASHLVAANFELIGNSTISGLALPQQADQAASKEYVDASVANLNAIRLKLPVHLASTAADAAMLNASTFKDSKLTSTSNIKLRVDGTDVNVGDRLLVKNVTNMAHSGVYDVSAVGASVSPWIIARASDAINGSYIQVDAGLANINTAWILTTLDPITLNTTELAWSKVGGTATAVKAGSGLQLTGDTLSVKGADTSLVVEASGVKVNVAQNFSWSADHRFSGTAFAVAATTSATVALRTNTTADSTLVIAASATAAKANIEVNAQDRLALKYRELQITSPLSTTCSIVEMQYFATNDAKEHVLARIPIATLPAQSTAIMNVKIVGHSVTSPMSLAFDSVLMVVRRSTVTTVTTMKSTLYRETDSQHSTTLKPGFATVGTDITVTLTQAAYSTTKPNTPTTLICRTTVRLEIAA